MMVEIGRISDGEFFVKPIETSYAGPLEVRRYINKITNRPDPLIKRADGQSFVHLSTLIEKGLQARIVNTNELLEFDTEIAELAVGE